MSKTRDSGPEGGMLSAVEFPSITGWYEDLARRARY